MYTSGPGINPLSVGSCVDAAFDGCCIDGECKITSDTIPVSCYCDSLCYTFGDCCDDIALTNCYPNTSKSPYTLQMKIYP